MTAKNIIRKLIREQFNQFQSYFISKQENYGSYEGIIHSDIEKIKNWFSKRNIDYKKYVNQIYLPVAFLNNINIDEEYRGMGYGNGLYSDFEQECYENGAHSILLESDNDESQVKGFNLDNWYKSLDFDIIGNEGGNSIMLKKL